MNQSQNAWPQSLPARPQSFRWMSALGCFTILSGVIVAAVSISFIVAGIYSIRSASQQAKDRSNNLAWRVPASYSVKQEWKSSIESFKAAQDPQWAEIATMISSEPTPLPLDLERFIQAIGESGEVKLQWIVRQSLGLSVFAENMTPPIRHDDSLLIHADWIKPNQEVRVIATMRNPLSQINTLYMLWLTKSSGEWKVFDWRDMLEPMSETDYLAHWFDLEDGESFQRFSEKISGIHDESIEVKQKISKIYTEALRANIEKPFRQHAWLYACVYLDSLSAWDQLDSIAKKLDPQTTRYHWYFRAKAALGKKDTPKAIEHFQKLTNEFGWYPDIPQQFSSRDLSDQEFAYIEPLLIRDLCYSKNSYSVFGFSDRYTESFYEKLVDALEGQENRNQVVENLIVNGRLSGKKALSLFWKAIENRDRFQDSHALARGFLAHSEKRWEDAARDLTPVFCSRKTQVNTLETTAYDSLSETVAECFVKASDIEPLWQACTNKSLIAQTTLQSRVRNIRRSDFNRDSIGTILNLIKRDEVTVEPASLVAIAEAASEISASPERALTNLIELLTEFSDKLALEVDPRGITYSKIPENSFRQIQSLDAVCYLIQETANKLNSWSQVRESLESHDLSFLLQASSLSLPCDRDQLSEALEWYQSTGSRDKDWWYLYHRSQEEYSQGRWELADELLAKAISIRKNDQDFEEWNSFAMNLGIAPYMESIEEEWFSQRMEMASRCKKVPDLLARLSASTDSDADFESDLVRGMKEIPLTEISSLDLESISLVLPMEDEVSQAELDRLRFRQMFYQRKFDQAFSLGLSQWQNRLNKDYRWYSDFGLLIESSLASGRLEELVKAQSNADDEEASMLKIAQAIHASDSSDFQERVASESFRGSWWRFDQGTKRRIKDLGWDSTVLEAGLALSQFPNTTSNPFGGILFLQSSLEVSELADRIDKELHSLNRVVTAMSDVSSIPSVQHAWKTKHNDQNTTVLLMKNDLNKESEVDSLGANQCFPESQWLIVIIGERPAPGESESGSAESLTSVSWASYIDTCKKLYDAIPSCVGYWHHSSEAFLEKPLWDTYRQSPSSSLIDPNRPMSHFLQLPGSDDDYEFDDEFEYQVGSICRYRFDHAVVSEYLQVKLVSFNRESSSWKIEVEQDSMIHDEIRKGYSSNAYSYLLSPIKDK